MVLSGRAFSSERPGAGLTQASVFSKKPGAFRARVFLPDAPLRDTGRENPGFVADSAPSRWKKWRRKPEIRQDSQHSPCSLRLIGSPRLSA